ncbi:MAG: hypothetical protein HRU15_04140, partial [Planctomycetes bacterium]|nr:hypothetical protein [Planctomycetota bacterium]
MNNQIPHHNYHSNNGSAILIVTSLLVLMVTLAMSFLSIVSRQRGSALLAAAQTRAEITMIAGQNITIKNLLEEYTDGIKYTTPMTAKWRIDNNPLNDPDSNPWTYGTAATGVPRLSWPGASTDPLINTPHGFSLADMTGTDVGGARNKMWGLDTSYDHQTKLSTYARWHSHEFYDELMKPIFVDKNLSNALQADIKNTARYVSRYAIEIMDLSAQLNQTNNFPGAPILPNASSDEISYNRFQNYLSHYGRSIKSMWASTDRSDSQGVSNYQFRSNDAEPAIDIFDEEPLNTLTTGEAIKFYNPASSNWNHRMLFDARLRIERTFRMNPLRWVNDQGGNDVLMPFVKSPPLSWAQIGLTHRSDEVMHAYGWISHKRLSFVPFANDMRDQSLGGNESVSTPWKINLLTSGSLQRSRMIAGLSSHLKHGALGENAANGCTADLFGRGYPEAFPLGLDDGRDIPLIGEIISNKDSGGAISYNYGTALVGNRYWNSRGNNYSGHNKNYFHHAYENSYWLDIFAALDEAIFMAQSRWGQGSDYIDANEASSSSYHFVNRGNAYPAQIKFSDLDANTTPED